jgi:GT2 family glycosyltransferase
MPLLDQDGQSLAPKAVRVAICIPTRGECKAGFTLDLARLVNMTTRRRPEVSIGFVTGTGTLIHDLRAKIARDALQVQPDYLFWLDDDMRFPPDALIRLLAHGSDIVGTNYTTRTMPPKPTAKTMAEDGIDFWHVPLDPAATGLSQVDACGFGCVLIRASVFAKLEEPWFSMPWCAERSMHVGEDVYFCTVARNAGFKTHIDQDLSRELRHSGSFEYAWEHFYAVQDEPAQQSGENEPAK